MIQKGFTVDEPIFILISLKFIVSHHVTYYVKSNENILTGLVEKSNKIFSRLCSRKLISEKELKYFTYSFKKATDLGKLYFLPKIHKRLSSVPVRPVISNCVTPTEKISEYLDHILKPIMQESWSYMKNSGDFLKKIKHLGQIPDGNKRNKNQVQHLGPNLHLLKLVFSWMK